MKIHVSIPITIDMIVEIDNFNHDNVIDQVKSICFDNPSIVVAAIEESDEDVNISRAD